MKVGVIRSIRGLLLILFAVLSLVNLWAYMSEDTDVIYDHTLIFIGVGIIGCILAQAVTYYIEKRLIAKNNEK
jgi:hypothetical protein